MKKGLLYILILAGVWLAPVEPLDMAKLEPVQVVWVSGNGNRVSLRTDTGHRGQGATVELALRDLKEKCPGVIYLDTAQYLLLDEDSETLIPSVGSYLKGSVSLCLYDGEELEQAAEYMAAHKSGVKLRDWKPGKPLPKINLEKTEKTSK